MPKYDLKEGILDKFIEKIFVKAATKAQSKAIDKLSKKDPKFAKNFQNLLKLRNDLEKDLKSKGIDIDQRGADILRNL
jgi:hypothetical protein|tara:strand:- start:326 stop:559 length:234 start_codon:yes stop_codon:yes gene_type:complete